MAKQQATDFYETFWRDSEYMAAYQLDSAMRDRFPAIQAVWGARPMPENVLDFGCGNGVLAHWMHTHGFGSDMLGVDISRTGIADATARFGSDRLRYRLVADLAELAGIGRFDVVVSSHVLEHMPDPLAALRALRPLAPLFVLEVPIEDALVPNLRWKLASQPRTSNPVGHLHFWTRPAFHALLAQAGYRILAEHHYASAPFSPYNSRLKRGVERQALAVLGLGLYSRLMATHDCVLAAPL